MASEYEINRTVDPRESQHDVCDRVRAGGNNLRPLMMKPCWIRQFKKENEKEDAGVKEPAKGARLVATRGIGKRKGREDGREGGKGGRLGKNSRAGRPG
jgi:hypothetical protein